MNLSDKDIRVILYALSVVKNYKGRFSEDADFLIDKIHWLKSPITTFSQLKNLLQNERKAY